MSDEILGYQADGTAIYPPIRGYIYTQAFIHCCECSKAISHVGGPGLNSLCVECYKEKNNDKNV